VDALTDLSIVIIARNEAKNIARAIESVLRAVEHWPQTEILLVDSASTDATVETAKQYPINIVRLDPNWFLSVAAGRHIGMHYTRGELVLHMDGDMELDPEWVNQSVSFILDHPQVAAVGGYWRNIYMRDGQIISEEDQNRDPQGRVLQVQYVGGASLYRRSAILQVGGFQPFIRGEEDVDLCMRLRHAGYKIVRLPYRMSRHYCIPPRSWAGNLRRLRLDLFLGHGQVPRYHLKTNLFWTYLLERGTFVVYLIGMLISLITLLLTLLLGNIALFGIWVLIVVAFLLVFSIKKRSLRKTLLSCLLQTLVTYSAVRGFLMTPRSPAEYPTDAEIVQVRYHHGGLGVEGQPAASMVQNPESSLGNSINERIPAGNSQIT
jgi:glycosyltransferase involved in cell wall biosynthesis